MICRSRVNPAIFKKLNTVSTYKSAHDSGTQKETYDYLEGHLVIHGVHHPYLIIVFAISNTT